MLKTVEIPFIDEEASSVVIQKFRVYDSVIDPSDPSDLIHVVLGGMPDFHLENLKNLPFKNVVAVSPISLVKFNGLVDVSAESLSDLVEMYRNFLSLYFEEEDKLILVADRMLFQLINRNFTTNNRLQHISIYEYFSGSSVVYRWMTWPGIRHLLAFIGSYLPLAWYWKVEDLEVNFQYLVSFLNLENLIQSTGF